MTVSTLSTRSRIDEARAVGGAGGSGVATSHGSERPRRRWFRLSLRLRITLVALAVVGLVLTLASVGLVRVLRGELLQQIDEGLRTESRVVALAVQSGNAPRAGLPERYIQVVTPSGAIVGSNDASKGVSLLTGPGPIRGADRLHLFTRNDPKLGRLRVIVRPYDEAGSLAVVVARPISQLSDTTRSLGRLLMGGVPLLTAALGFLIWQMVGRSLRPVERVDASLRAITTHNLNGRVPTTGTGDEIDRLTTTVNDMLARLESSVQAEQRFLADASHELRSPIAGMRALLETIPEGESVPEPDRRAVLASLGRLQDLAEQLLDLARSDRPQPRLRPVDFDEVVLRLVAAARRQDSAVEIDTRGVSGGQVLGDEAELTRLVENLLTNATRHARSMVRLTVTESDGSVRLGVSDDGPGISPTDRRRVFERFTRLDDARSRDRGGAGLGLAIVAQIVEHHGGSVSVDEAEGEGAAFEVVLPSAVDT